MGVAGIPGGVKVNSLSNHTWATRKVSLGAEALENGIRETQGALGNWKGSGILLLAFPGLGVLFSVISWSRALAVALPLGRGGVRCLRPLPLLD